MALSPKDMDFIEAKHAAAREIALAFGVPPMLLGIPGDNTYANYQEANRAFWRADRAAAGGPHPAGADAHGWRPRFGERLELRPALDRIEALGTERAALWDRVTARRFPHRGRETRRRGARTARRGWLIIRP